jgi:hypothetical protein
VGPRSVADGSPPPRRRRGFLRASPAQFFRNSGNEGYCSEGSNPWDVRTIRLLLRNLAAGNATVSNSAVFGSPRTSISYYFVRTQGVLLEVDLPAPGRGRHVFGDLTVAWTPVPPPWVLATVPSQTERARTQRLREEAPFREFYTRLPAASQQRWLAARHKLAQARLNRVAPLAIQMLPCAKRSSPPGPSPRARLAPDGGRRKAEDQALCAALGEKSIRSGSQSCAEATASPTCDSISGSLAEEPLRSFVRSLPERIPRTSSDCPQLSRGDQTAFNLRQIGIFVTCRVSSDHWSLENDGARACN